jgi:hypothetical protein
MIVSMTDFKAGAGQYIYDEQLVSGIIDPNDFDNATAFVRTFGQQKGVAVTDMDLDHDTANFEVKRLAIFWVLCEVAQRNISLNPNFPQMQTASRLDEFGDKAKMYKARLEEQKGLVSIAMLRNSLNNVELSRPATFDFYRA